LLTTSLLLVREQSVAQVAKVEIDSDPRDNLKLVGAF